MFTVKLKFFWLVPIQGTLPVTFKKTLNVLAILSHCYMNYILCYERIKWFFFIFNCKVWCFICEQWSDFARNWKLKSFGLNKIFHPRKRYFIPGKVNFIPRKIFHPQRFKGWKFLSGDENYFSGDEISF